VPYYVIWDALVPWLVQLAESKAEMLEKALDMLLLCFEPHELRKVVSEVMEALSYRSRTASFSSESLPYTGSFRYLRLACALVRRREVLECWWQSWGFEESLEGLLTKKAVNKNDLAALLPQVRSSPRFCCSFLQALRATPVLGRYRLQAPFDGSG
jgi:Kip1 ubiquitination-promoting complex protein 1